MRVLTWNLWWRFGPWEARRKGILAVLREAAPDIVGLQEVWADEEENLAAWLASELGLHWTWSPFGAPTHWRRRIPGSTADIGVAVLSRRPILRQDTVRLPAAGGQDDGRVALHALIDNPGAPVPFFTTHLNSAPSESAVRCAQVRTLARFVAERTPRPGFPAVVTGDHNAWPDSDEIRLLGGYKTAPAVPGQVLLDAWEYADPTAPSATWDPANPHVTAGPPVRVDYIHVGPPGPAGIGTIRSIHRLADHPINGTWRSDHLAVQADLTEASAKSLDV